MLNIDDAFLLVDLHVSDLGIGERLAENVSHDGGKEAGHSRETVRIEFLGQAAHPVIVARQETIGKVVKPDGEGARTSPQTAAPKWQSNANSTTD
jgi:hypothetical protein